MDRTTEPSGDSYILAAGAVALLLYLLLRILRRGGAGLSAGGGGGTRGGGESPRALRRRAKRMKSQGRNLTAGELFLAAGDDDAALKTFLDGGMMHRAAPLFEAKGEHSAAAEAYEASGEHARAAKAWARLRDHDAAGRNYDLAGLHGDAVKHWTAAGDVPRAGNSLWQAGEFEKAAHTYQKAGMYDEAGRAYQVLLDAERAKQEEGPLKNAGPPPPSDRLVELARLTGRAYMTGGNLAAAADAFVSAGLHDDAMKAFDLAGRHGDAAEMALKAGDHQRAAELFRRAGEEERSLSVQAIAAQQTGDQRQAAALLEQAGDLKGAAALWEQTGELARAAKVRELLEDWAGAAQLWERVGHPARAAADWERGGERRRAADLYKKAGDFDQELRLRREIHDDVRVGEILYLADEHALAEEVLKGVTESSGQWRQACRLLGDIYREADNAAAATVKYRQAVAEQRPGPDTAEVFYQLARCAMTSGEAELALQTLRSLREYDPTFRDVQALFDQARRSSGEEPSSPAVHVPLELVPLTPSQEAMEVSRTRSDASAPPRYERLDLLGQGGMATVWRAKDTVLGREVALKVLQGVDTDQEAARKRFLREARSAAVLNHPAVVTVYDFGEDAGDLFIAMELVHGMTLRQIVREGGALGIPLIRQILVQACAAIGYAHDQGVIHRDIKPANMMWTGDHGLRITDFGLAKLLNDKGLTLMSRVLGTPYYMSPEQIRGDSVDHRTDIYSMGVTLYELATAKVPFSRGNVLQAHLKQTPESPTSFREDLPAWLSDAILACIRKDAADRPQTMAALAALAPPA